MFTDYLSTIARAHPQFHMILLWCYTWLNLALKLKKKAAADQSLMAYQVQNVPNIVHGLNDLSAKPFPFWLNNKNLLQHAKVYSNCRLYAFPLMHPK